MQGATGTKPREETKFSAMEYKQKATVYFKQVAQLHNLAKEFPIKSSKKCQLSYTTATHGKPTLTWILYLSPTKKKKKKPTGQTRETFKSFGTRLSKERGIVRARSRSIQKEIQLVR